MSVINTMLKNIDQRQTTHTNEQAASVAISPVRDYQSVLFKVLSVLLACVLIIVAYIYLPVAQPHNNSNKLAANPEPSSELTVEAPQTNDAQNEVAKEPAITQSINTEVRIQTEQVANLTPPKSISEPAVSSNKSIQPTTSAQPKLKAAIEVPTPVIAKTAQKPASNSLARDADTVKNTPSDNKIVKVASKKHSKAQLIEQQLTQAKQALQFALYDDAINDLSAILAKAPEHIEARNLLAATYFQQQDVLMAQQLLVAGIKIKPEVVQWRVMLSKILILQQEYEGVLALLVNELEPHANLEFWVLKGTAAQNAQQHQVALNSFTQLTQIQPQQAKWWLALATSKDALGEFVDAKHLYKVALDLGGLNAAMTQHALQRLVALKEAA